MTVQVLFNEHPKESSRILRALEYALLIIGLIAVDVYVWVNVDTVFNQAYGSWSLDQQIHGYRPSLGAFIADKLGVPWLVPAQAQPPKQEQAKVEPRAPVRLPAFALIGRVEVPRLGLSVVVREGVDDSTLRTAVGHMPSTPLPGQPGNAALAGHRDTLFRKLQNIRKDDHITIQTVNGTFEYVVESLKIVQPDDLAVLKANKGDRLLTLITCYPFHYIGSAPQRFIVRARQVVITARAQTPQTRARS